MPKFDTKVIGTLIRNARKNLNISQSELGKTINMSQRNISSIENGNVRTDLETIKKIAHILSIPVEDLLSLEKQEHSDLVPLSSDEIVLIKNYRLCTKAKQQALIELSKR